MPGSIAERFNLWLRAEALHDGREDELSYRWDFEEMLATMIKGHCNAVVIQLLLFPSPEPGALYLAMMLRRGSSRPRKLNLLEVAACPTVAGITESKRPGSNRRRSSWLTGWLRHSRRLDGQTPEPLRSHRLIHRRTIPSRRTKLGTSRFPRTSITEQDGCERVGCGLDHVLAHQVIVRRLRQRRRPGITLLHTA